MNNNAALGISSSGGSASAGPAGGERGAHRGCKASKDSLRCVSGTAGRAARAPQRQAHRQLAWRVLQHGGREARIKRRLWSRRHIVLATAFARRRRLRRRLRQASRHCKCCLIHRAVRCARCLRRT